ncbi:HTH-type transcriptional regulator NsrR [Azospirillaceae bacterium]
MHTFDLLFKTSCLFVEGTELVRLTQFSNFVIRILMYTGIKGNRPSTIQEMAQAYGISYDHLKKAAAEACRLGYLKSVMGRNGGMMTAKSPELINIGEVIRQTEGILSLVECFDPNTNTCPLHKECRLRLALQEALNAFFCTLDKYTLSDLIDNRERIASCLGIEEKLTRARSNAPEPS